MALKIYERYEPLANPGTAEYPTGSIKNKSAPQNKDGTPIEQDWANDLLGMRDAILAAGNVQADGNVENAVNSQIVEALKAFLVESERVVQSPGSSEDDVMSQKAVTDAFAQLSGGANADFTAMPEVGGSPIVESGSNANGSWTKWADGTMICFKRLVTTVDPSPFAITFPQSFADAPMGFAQRRTASPLTLIAIASNETTSGMGIYFDGNPGPCNWYAIGRWK